MLQVGNWSNPDAFNQFKNDLQNGVTYDYFHSFNPTFYAQL